MVGAFEVDILDALDINGRSTSIGETTNSMTYSIISEGEKDSSMEVD